LGGGFGEDSKPLLQRCNFFGFPLSPVDADSHVSKVPTGSRFDFCALQPLLAAQQGLIARPALFLGLSASLVAIVLV
jgi:hypothetical protein